MNEKPPEARLSDEELDRLLPFHRTHLVGQLASGLAHDLNNTLTVILSCADLVLDSLPKEDNRREDLEEISTAARRAEALVQQILAFGRGAPSARTMLDPNEVIRGVEPMLRRALGARVDIATRLAPELDAVWIDRVHLEQVLIHLALNARAAMPQGGKLTIESSTSSERRGGTPSRRRVAVTVRDTGAGAEPLASAGLGLAIVQGVIERAGGRMVARSTPGVGTAVELSFPAAQEPSP